MAGLTGAGEYFGGCSVSVPHICCTKVVMTASYRLTFLAGLLYDQLYFSYPNQGLLQGGTLVDGAKVWRQFIMGCIGASFYLLDKDP